MIFENFRGHTGDNKRAKDELKEHGDGLHFSTLYDQDEDESGEHYDLATGIRYDNSTNDERDVRESTLSELTDSFDVEEEAKEEARDILRLLKQSNWENYNEADLDQLQKELGLEEN